MKQEESLQIAVCAYLKLNYPSVIFTSESSGVRLTMGQAVKAKKMRSHHKLPDLWILEPRGRFHGMMIELKAVNPFKRNGEPKTTHFAEQIKTLDQLIDKGFLINVIFSFDDAKRLIDWYMSLESF
jgi:hypothetical protein